MSRAPLLLDACIAINLAATDRLQHIAQLTNVTFALVRQAASEVGYLRDIVDGRSVRTPIDVEQYVGDALEIIDLTSAEYPLYISLALEVDDGEAATIAVAAQRRLPLATDDRKARRLCTPLGILEPLRTPSLLRAYADAAELQRAQLHDLLGRIRDRASFQPPRSDPDFKWWNDIIEAI